MPIRAVTPILNVRDVPASIDWFESLGWSRGFIWPQDDPQPGFGSICSGDAEIFLCKDAQGSRGTIMPRVPGDDRTDGVWMSWWLDNPAEVDALHQKALDLGLTVTYPPTDTPWNVREFHLRHPDGHMARVSASITD
jgi:catechol 2,3-dioxygenase-like lactoylglutathione lyase family enzyme